MNDGDGLYPDDSQLTDITNQDIEQLADGEVLTLDLASDSIYRIDFSNNFDMSRVVLKNPGAGSLDTGLDRWLEASLALGIDYTAAPDKTFLVTGHPRNFGDLSAEQLDTLESQQVLALDGDSVTYWCAILAYGCHIY
jgi:hypothetical protein